MSEHSPGEGTVAEVEFVFQRSDPLFVSLSREQECTFELAAIVPRPDGRYAEFFNVTDADPEAVASTARDHEGVDVTLLREYETGALFEFLVAEHCPAVSLARQGALPRSISGVEGTGRIVVEIPSRYDPSAVVEDFLDEYPGARLATKQKKEAVSPLFTRTTFQHVVQSRLTDRQREVLRTAFEAGYYEWPRRTTGEEIAAELGISSATFSEHVAAAEQKLLAVTFEGHE